MNILIAIEDEVFGNAIIDYVIRLGWVNNVNIKLLHIVEPLLVDSYMSVVPAPILSDVVNENKESAKRLLDRLEARLKQNLEGCSIEKSVFEDFPKSAIIDEAKNWNADLIMVGSHGRKGMSKFFLGSVSQAVSNHADRPVLIVRMPQQAPAKEKPDAA